MNFDLIKSLGIHVEVCKDYPVVCETLERIGIISHKDRKVFPSCYCVKYEDVGVVKYTICHFKEMFLLQNKESTYGKDDKARLMTIVYFMQKWGFVKVINASDVGEILIEKISVLPYKDKKNYTIVHKFKNSE